MSRLYLWVIFPDNTSERVHTQLVPIIPVSLSLVSKIEFNTYGEFSSKEFTIILFSCLSLIACLQLFRFLLHKLHTSSCKIGVLSADRFSDQDYFYHLFKVNLLSQWAFFVFYHLYFTLQISRKSISSYLNHFSMLSRNSRSSSNGTLEITLCLYSQNSTLCRLQ